MPELADPRTAKTPQLTDGERELLDKLFGNWLIIPDSFKAALADYVAQNSLIPISQVRGFTQFTAKQVVHRFTPSPWTTTSASYVDSSPVVELTDLSPGQYLLMYGFHALPGTQTDILGNISINGDSPANGDEVGLWNASTTVGASASTMRANLKTLTESINTIKLQFKLFVGSTADVNVAFIIALRVANP